MQPISLIVRLDQQLHEIESQVLDFLDASTIEKRIEDPFSEVLLIANDHYWGKDDDNQMRLQLKLLKSYTEWFEHFHLLFHHSSSDMQKQISKTNSSIRKWIEKENGWSVPFAIEEAKARFKEDIQTYYELIRILKTSDKANIILVPDTNALIISPDVTHFSKSIGQENYMVILISPVLSELDKLKRDHRDLQFREKVEKVIKRIKGLRQQGNMKEGVVVNKTVTVKMMGQEPNFEETLSWLDPNNLDDRIIATALEIQREEPASTVILVTGDINHQNKAEMANLPYVEPPENEL